jgi:hypothetical protein
MWSMTTNYSTIWVMVTDIVASTVIFTIVGMIIVLTWGKGKAV